VIFRKKHKAEVERIVLESEARIQAAGGDRNAVKLEIYRELRAKGFDYEADLLMTFDVVVRANMTQQPNITYNFNNSQIAGANFGTQIGNITASLTAVIQKNPQSANFASALKQLTEGIVNATELTDQQKKEALDALSFVGKQAEEPTDKRQTGILKPVLESLPKIFGGGAALINLWHAVGPHVLAFFGF